MSSLPVLICTAPGAAPLLSGVTEDEVIIMPLLIASQTMVSAVQKPG